MPEASSHRPTTQAPGPGEPLPLFSLTCHKNMDMSVVNLASLLRLCRDPIELVVQDDGSLTPADCDRLREEVGSIRIISRAEADDLVAPALAGKPRCQEFRRANPLALKVIDPPLISGGPFLLCDGDILFLRPFAGLDRRPHGGEDLVYMRDFANSYGRKWQDQFTGPYRARRADFVNSGLVYCAPRTFDPDFAEWYLSNPQYDLPHCHAEQLLWAAMAARVRSHFFDPRQVAFPLASLEYRPTWIALHFISPLRYLLADPEYVAHLRAGSERAVAAGVAQLETRPAIYASLARHVLRRIYWKFRPHYITQAAMVGPPPIDRRARVGAARG